MKFKVGDKILYKPYFLEKPRRGKVYQVAPLKIIGRLFMTIAQYLHENN